MFLIIMILTIAVSVHAMMSAGTLTTVPTNAGSVVVHHVSIPSTVIIPSIITGSVKIPSVKIPSVVPASVNQQKVSKVTTNEPEKPIRKEISPEALRVLNERRQAALDKEMKSRILQPKPSYSININHDGDHWSILK